jgi:hypothetical protein
MDLPDPDNPVTITSFGFKDFKRQPLGLLVTIYY